MDKNEKLVKKKLGQDIIRASGLKIISAIDTYIEEVKYELIDKTKGK